MAKQHQQQQQPAPVVFVELGPFPHDMLLLAALSPRHGRDVTVAGIAVTPAGGWGDIALETAARVFVACTASRGASAVPPLFLVEPNGEGADDSGDDWAGRAGAAGIMRRKPALDVIDQVPLQAPAIGPIAKDAVAAATVGTAAAVAPKVAECIRSSGAAVTLISSSGVLALLAAALPLLDAASVTRVLIGGGVVQATGPCAEELQSEDSKAKRRGEFGFSLAPRAAEAVLAASAADEKWWLPSTTLLTRDVTADTSRYAVAADDVRRLALLTTPATAPWPAAEAQLVGMLWSQGTYLEHSAFGGRPQCLGKAMLAAVVLGATVASQAASVTAVTADGVVQTGAEPGQLAIAASVDAACCRDLLLGAHALGAVTTSTTP